LSVRKSLVGRGARDCARDGTQVRIALGLLIGVLPWAFLAHAQKVEPPDLKAWAAQPGAEIRVCPLDFTKDEIPDAVFRWHTIRVEIRFPDLRYVTNDDAYVWANVHVAKPLPSDWSLADYLTFLEAEPQFLLLRQGPYKPLPLPLPKPPVAGKDGAMSFFRREGGSLIHVESVHLKADENWFGPDPSSPFVRALVAWAQDHGAPPDLAWQMVPAFEVWTGVYGRVRIPSHTEAALGCRPWVNPLVRPRP